MMKPRLAVIGLICFLFSCAEVANIQEVIEGKIDAAEDTINEESGTSIPSPNVSSPSPPPVNILLDTEDVFPVTGTTYYVATNGTDSNPGTEVSPWATLQHAAGQVSQGDLVLVQNGTYAGFDIRKKYGAKTQPIVFKAKGKEVFVHPIKNGNRKDNINVENSDYIVIDGFIVNQYDPEKKGNGIRVAVAKGIIIINNRVGPCGRHCIFTAYAPGVKIRNNKAFEAQVRHGISVSNSDTPDDKPIIRKNEVYGNYLSGIQINGDCNAGGDGMISGALIEGNIVRDNYSKGISLISVEDTKAQNNLIYGNRMRDGAAGIHLADEVGCGKPSRRNLVVNNTIVEPRMAGIRMTDGAVDNIIFNNVVYTGKPNTPPIADEVGQNDINTNLTFISMMENYFIDPVAHNYRLITNSQGIDSGKVIYQSFAAPATDIEGTARPQGRGMDPGAYESTP